ncbi:MAG: FtsX-like permease family protein [Chloroflexi bacterium]|nr:FtsX-like permease family protein [Chloroflexota bacterium]
MLFRVVSASIRHRLGLYVPMLITIIISLALLGAAEIVGVSFKGIVNREMEKYGANVILIPEKGEVVNEGVPVQVRNTRLGDAEVNLAMANTGALLAMNPGWLVKGEGDVLVGSSVAAQLGLTRDSPIEIDGIQGKVAILESGTEFDAFVIVNGEAAQPSMVLLKTADPAQYKGKNAIILEEITRAKYGFLESIRRLMLYVALISALSAIAVIINLARIDAGERQKEFGILGALGALPSTIARFILAEFLLLSGFSAVLGLVFSMALSWALVALTAKAWPALSFGAVWYVFGTALASFVLASSIYIMEFRRHSIVEEIRGE